jgi:hypothetical protein
MSESEAIGPQFQPDQYLNQSACDCLEDFAGGYVVPPDSLSDLMRNLKGFSDYPDYILNVVAEIQNRFKRDIRKGDIATFRATAVDYDPEGLIGIRFDNPRLNAVIIQPNGEADNFRQVNVCVKGGWYNARPVPDAGVVFNTVETKSDSRTAQMMNRLNLPYRNGMSDMNPDPNQGLLGQLFQRVGAKFKIGE